MQGRLKSTELTVRITSRCEHCRRRIELEVDHELRWRVSTLFADPLLFEPDIDWATFRGPNIIHDY